MRNIICKIFLITIILLNFGFREEIKINCFNIFYYTHFFTITQINYKINKITI